MGIVCFILYGMTSYGYCLFYIVWYDKLWVLFVLYCIGIFIPSSRRAFINVSRSRNDQMGIFVLFKF